VGAVVFTRLELCGRLERVSSSVGSETGRASWNARESLVHALDCRAVVPRSPQGAGRVLAAVQGVQGGVAPRIASGERRGLGAEPAR
jgi:hypothetical protein